MAHATTLDDDVHAADHAHSHPGQREYIRIAIILACITAIEVTIYYIDVLSGILVPALFALSTIKFVMVVGYFMHLKFDDRRLAWIFSAGMSVALAIYIGTYSLMHFHKIVDFVSNMIA